MDPTDDLSVHAASSSADFYALLSLKPTATDSEIRTAFRKTSLKYHPDKVADTPKNVERFLLVKTAYDVLSDPKIRVLYDRTREAANRKRAETEKLEAGRRTMVNDLERREQQAKDAGSVGIMGVKRSRHGEEETLEQKLEREIMRISEENRQKKSALTEKLERERMEEDQGVADERQARERLASAKERGGRKNKQEKPIFTFQARESQPLAPPGLAEVQSIPITTPTFEQTILERLRTTQREKERMGRVEVDASAEHTTSK
jgi:DnaJ homolog subfamily C member 17